MLSAFFNLFRLKETRNKILFTFFMIIIFRIGTYIPVPGVDSQVLKTEDSGIFSVFNTFAGGALAQFSVFAMGIMPYITASIVVQLMQMDVSPTLTEWSKQGEVGQKKIQKLVRVLAIILAFIQSLVMSYGFNRVYAGLIKDTSILGFVTIAIVLTAGTAFLLWMGDLITQKGVGNGISIIILSGIIAGLPVGFIQVYESQIKGAANITLAVLKIGVVVLVVLAIIMGVVYFQEALRKIPIQYAQARAGRKMLGARSTYLPLKVNGAGVIPVIFAVAFLQIPRTVTIFWNNEKAQKIASYFDMSHWIGITLYVALIIAFAYFYVIVQVNPEKMADNLRKQGSYVPGIRPGKSTEEYITRVLYRLTFVGSIFLAAIATLPTMFATMANLPATVQIGGTSLIIVVSVALETVKQLNTQLTEKNYSGFIKFRKR
ncbi:MULTISPECIES: preprotein translocase subunit SecY [unclassified Gemella]|uniref:preprotein translocase subunit SecY n=1 Tax=unclassified Gemella TaxID=2624949 RepID=UPI0010736943|nr:MULTISPECIES: preprotein translocase subunit SecY [unclassified Gemella]MBF0709908.1 preprotein translocase subunit SecY [Gemella sp. GL1.1]MBF0746788.1 preprotein translocase subunit SecY [Gemella sp. 19428wG2_WT2a]NYS27252.1 preprotein translocase subunit SecY [Gemella sp. GL1]TFU59513.1 preprotein translocase subunit SecY [Gemella sp. WT2a]